MDSKQCSKCAKILGSNAGRAAHERHCKPGAKEIEQAPAQETPVAEVVTPAVAHEKASAVSVIARRGGYSVLFDGSYVIENKYGTVIGRFQTEADALLNLQGLQRFRR